MYQVNFNNFKHLIDGHDIDQLFQLLSKGTRAKTRTRLLSCLTYGRHLIPSCGILDRLIKENGQWRYIAGQSYTDEIRTIRDTIVK